MFTNQLLVAQEILSIKSGYLKRKTPVLVQTPDDYEPSKRYPLVFMLHGYSENFSQWSEVTDLKELANHYQMILVCPEGFVSYYLNSPKLKDSQYEDFFFRELVPKIEKNYSIDHGNVFITGLSMGGYGALSLFIKHPDYFNTAASTSGALEFDADKFREVSLLFFGSERMLNDLEESLGDPLKNDWNQFSVSTLLQQNTGFDKAFLVDCGLQDPLLHNTLKIKEWALNRKLPVQITLQPGEHNAEYWQKSVEYHFLYFKQHLKKQ